MKNIIISAIFASILMAYSAKAQSNDPSFASNNYKHPNVAKAAAKKEKRTQVQTLSASQQTSLATGEVGNYKAPQVKTKGQKNQTSLVFPVSSKPVSSDLANYKHLNPRVRNQATKKTAEPKTDDKNPEVINKK